MMNIYTKVDCINKNDEYIHHFIGVTYRRKKCSLKWLSRTGESLQSGLPSFSGFCSGS
jgi:hypothetical protein